MNLIHIAIPAIGFGIGSAYAADFSFTGDFSNDNEVQPFNFSVAGPASDVTLRTLSFSGGTNAAGTTIASGGFDPIIVLANATTGAIFSGNDDASGLTLDSFLMINLPAGNYIATLTQYSNLPVGALLTDGFTGTGQLNFGGHDSHWALDVLNVNSGSAGIPYVSPIPEPETYAVLLAGLGLLGWRVRQFGLTR
jgi:hypothetical protein